MVRKFDNVEKPISHETFNPVGAVAFFLMLLVFFAVVWFSLYFLLISRHG